MENADNFFFFSCVHLEQDISGLEEVWEERETGFWKENKERTSGMREPKARVWTPVDFNILCRLIMIKNSKGTKHQTNSVLAMVQNSWKSFLIIIWIHGCGCPSSLNYTVTYYSSYLAIAAHEFAEFCHFIHLSTFAHSLKDVLLNPFVHSRIQPQWKKFQGTTEIKQSCLFAVTAVEITLAPKNLCDSSRKDKTNEFFLNNQTGPLLLYSDSQNSIRKYFLVIHKKVVIMKCKLKTQQNYCLPFCLVSTLNLNIWDECVIVAILRV